MTAELAHVYMTTTAARPRKLVTTFQTNLDMLCAEIPKHSRIHATVCWVLIGLGFYQKAEPDHSALLERQD